MTFNELMYVIAFLTPIFSALMEGKKAGFFGVVIGLVVGAGFGVGSVVMTKAFFTWVRRQPELGKPTPSGLWAVLSRILCVGLFIYFGSVGILGMFVTKLIIHYA